MVKQKPSKTCNNYITSFYDPLQKRVIFLPAPLLLLFSQGSSFTETPRQLYKIVPNFNIDINAKTRCTLITPYVVTTKHNLLWPDLN